jgi:hypothetical protein
MYELEEQRTATCGYGQQPLHTVGIQRWLRREIDADDNDHDDIDEGTERI